MNEDGFRLESSQQALSEFEEVSRSFSRTNRFISLISNFDKDSADFGVNYEYS